VGSAESPDETVRGPDEIAELRAEVSALRDELDLVRAQSGTRRQRRRRRQADSESGGSSGIVTRRRLFGLVGGAAAAGVGGALLAASPAEAATDLVIDANNSGSGTTILTTSGDQTAFAINAPGTSFNTSVIGLVANATNASGAVVPPGNQALGIAGVGLGTGVFGQSTSTSTTLNVAGVQGEASSAPGVAGTSGSGAGVSAFSTTGPGVAAASQMNYGGSFGASGLAPLFLAPATTAGTPTTGNHQAGELLVDKNGVLFYCVQSGTPGAWVDLSDGGKLIPIPPERVYDSRMGEQPTTGPKSPISNGATVTVDVTGPIAGAGTNAVPPGAPAVLGNITAVLPSGGCFLAVFANGASPPATSNVNAAPGQVIANSFTSQVGTSNEIAITCGGGPVDFIIDLFGFYI
jgi:hypothetical protein